MTKARLDRAAASQGHSSPDFGPVLSRFSRPHGKPDARRLIVLLFRSFVSPADSKFHKDRDIFLVFLCVPKEETQPSWGR